MNEPNPRFDPECAVCDEPTHVQELVDSPFDGPRERWCVKCFRDWQEEIERRMSAWEDEEHLFI